MVEGGEQVLWVWPRPARHMFSQVPGRVWGSGWESGALVIISTPPPLGKAGVAPSLLFFGCRNVDKDCLYAEEWGRLRVGNILSLYSLAASRDQDHKIYVQDRIREAAAAVWEALDRGG